tara:strand:+ start:1745 stop:2245 length:501 start_codon:yes stop_codon:yes gene_type:complete
MSENINLKELPHQFLLRKYSVNPQVLGNDGKQMIKDLEKTIRLVASKSKDGNVKLTPATQQKISTYDRFICDSVFEYLENQDKISETQSEKVEDQMDEQREDLEDKMDEIHKEEVIEQEQVIAEKEEQDIEQPNTETEAQTEVSSADGEEQQPKDENVKIGFWDWD